ncbi:MAG TPA: alpha/beta hydrolase [Candidatus Limnocylindrales bacterium]|nr:alpha/beta hydrolase [Candidatus Limnocylindrales bacterium]
MTPDPAAGPLPALRPISLDAGRSPDPDPAAEPEGFLVTADDGTRIHFHDWGAPPAPDGGPVAGIVLVPGLLAPAWSWAPVARRLALVRRTVVADLRGHGLSDAPQSGYALATLAADVVVVAEGSGALDGGAVVLAGHGFGAMVAAGAAALLGGRCAGLVLVDGGWERVEETAGVDVEAFLRGLDEPPEVLRSMDAWLADRRAFDPASWDADQERAARDGVVETAAGHVLRSVRPHVIDAVVRSMFGYEPAQVLAAVPAPVTALVAFATGDVDQRLAELRRTAVARAAAGLEPIRVAGFPTDAHNLMRYRPAEVAAAILNAEGRP